MQVNFEIIALKSTFPKLGFVFDLFTRFFSQVVKVEYGQEWSFRLLIDVVTHS